MGADVPFCGLERLATMVIGPVLSQACFEDLNIYAIYLIFVQQLHQFRVLVAVLYSFNYWLVMSESFYYVIAYGHV